MATTKKSSSKSSSKTPASKKSPGRPPKAAGAPNKSQFIRDQPLTLSAKEVVAKGKAQGITLTDAFVYTTRSQAKKSAEKQQSGAPAKKVGRPPKSAAVTASGSHEQQIRKVALTIGIVSVEAIVRKIKTEAGL